MRFSQKTSLMLWGTLFFCTSAAAQDVSVRRVTDRVIVLSMSNLGMHTNITVIESQKGLVIIETEITPYIMSKIKAEAEKYLGRNDWIYVINTHNHLHHAAGNILFRDAQVVGHETMRMDWLENRLSTESGRRGYCDTVGTIDGLSKLRKALAQGGLTPQQERDIRRKIRFMRDVEKEIMNGFEIRNPDITFNDRFTLDIGDVHLRLIYWGNAVQHSSIIIHVVEDNMLVSTGIGSGWLPNFYGKANQNSIQRWIAILDELCDDKFRIDTIIGVHSADFFTTKQNLQYKHEYLSELLDGLKNAKKLGLSLEQTKKELAFDKRFSRFRRIYNKPENLNEKHLENINVIWNLLYAEK